MGLRDILTGMQNGPRGQRPPTSGGSGGGMSPIVLALLGLLAYKALKGRGGQTANPGGAGQTPRLPPGGQAQAGNAGGGLGDILGGLFGGRPAAAPGGTAAGGTTAGGGLGDILSGGLGGLLGGAAAGSVLSGGLGNLIKGFQDSGHGHAAESWVGTGPNKEIAPGDLADALGSDTLDTLSRQTGMGQNDLLEALRQQLPDFVDQLTPHGRIPTEEEASRMV
ncbi:MAG TPA: YidB family protein [Xanthobacteraceae bacterium]|nr:YidB family protein [Xanthobacteraceae bacterium]